MESEDKRLAWFPAPFLELSEGEDDDDEEFLGGGLFYLVTLVLNLLEKLLFIYF